MGTGNELGKQGLQLQEESMGEPGRMFFCPMFTNHKVALPIPGALLFS